MCKCVTIAAVAAVVLGCVSGASAVSMETVTVGNAGNAADDTGYGWVSTTYNMGTYEVTAGQYREFLNAVAKSDPYGLYNSSMDSNAQGCQITQHGSDGNYTYDFSGGTVEAPGSTAADWENRPVNFVSWGDAARFSNWMYNGQGSGDTEDGSYYLNGATTDAQLMGITREADATWVIPSEDEWYKAAYHENDGVTGNYFDYPTGNDGAPSNVLDGGGNNATFYDGGYTIGSPYYRTEAAAHVNSDSPYGTFDQGGNLWEWTETASGGSFRKRRGGSYMHGANFLSVTDSGQGPPTSEVGYIGFRVSEVPEPATMALLALGSLGILRRRRR